MDMTDHSWLEDVLDDLAQYCSNNRLHGTNELVREAQTTLKLELGTKPVQRGPTKPQLSIVDETRH